METALITGASGGIGLELARVFAKKRVNLILVARSKQKLESIGTELEEMYGIQVTRIDHDLSLDSAADDVYARVRSEGLDVDYLVNNAGSGMYGRFYLADRTEEARMIAVNILTPTSLTRLFLIDMINKGHGRIMNVCSNAAFQPVPLMALYAASKVYLLFLTEAVSDEVRSTGITITAYCPGPTRTGFQKRAGMENARLMKGKHLPSADQVAQYGYDAMMKGKAVAVYGIVNKILIQSIRFAPRFVVLRIVRAMTERGYS